MYRVKVKYERRRPLVRSVRHLLERTVVIKNQSVSIRNQNNDANRYAKRDLIPSTKAPCWFSSLARKYEWQLWIGLVEFQAATNTEAPSICVIVGKVSHLIWPWHCFCCVWFATCFRLNNRKSKQEMKKEGNRKRAGSKSEMPPTVKVHSPQRN